MYRTIRRRARQSPQLVGAYARLRRARRAMVERQEIMTLRRSRRRLSSAGDSAGVVVSLTSFPARIEHAWIPIETIFLQSQPPDRIVLVLAEEEFPARALPRTLLAQQSRGLEIVWVPHDGGSLDKLVPTRLASPDATIVTVDDDALYAPWMLAALTEHAQRHPGAVVGHRGRAIARDEHGLTPYHEWKLASRATPEGGVLLTGVGGILYPPAVLSTELLSNVELAATLCPTADDIWLWAVETVAGVPIHCLGRPSWRPLRQQADTPRLETINLFERQNDVQLTRVIEHFGISCAGRAERASVDEQP